MTTGKMVANVRESRGVLQKELAKAINIDPVVLNRIEKDKRPARGDELKAIADYFNVSTDYLLGRDNFNQNTSLSKEEKNLLRGFDSLTADGKNLLIGIINSLMVSHSRKNSDENSRVIQSKSGGSNFLITGGENHSFNVTSV